MDGGIAKIRTRTGLGAGIGTTATTVLGTGVAAPSAVKVRASPRPPMAGHPAARLLPSRPLGIKS